MVNHAVANSVLLSSRFEIEVLPLAFAASFEDLDRVSLRKLVRLLQVGARLVHALATRRPHAVYLTLSPKGAAFWRDCILVAIIKLFAVPRIYHLHGKTRAHRARQLYRWAFRDAWVIHLSERLVDELGDLVPRARVLIVPNGVAERTPLRTDQRGPTRLLYLSNLTETKGPLVLIAALGLLRARGIAFEATLAGAVHDPELLAKCRAAIRDHGLEHQARYIGPAYGERKQRLFDEHDIFVLPTLNDAFPLVVLEAMQAGMPIVTTREGALPEIVEDGTTGLLAPPGDVEALASCLARLVADPGMRRRFGEQGRARCLERYTRAAFETNLGAALWTCVQADRGGTS